MSLSVIALEPYYGGSHQAFLDGWSSRSEHQWSCHTLPAHHWKWRMRHAPLTFASMLEEAGEPTPDVMFASDMLDVAAFRALAPRRFVDVPLVVYFHENQITYPDNRRLDADMHFAFTNVTSALAADEVWFNSAFHRDEFLSAAQDLVRRMPDYQPCDSVSAIRARSHVLYPGIAGFPAREQRAPGPMRILWVARWEADKNPELFVEAVRAARTAGIEFELNVLGGVPGQAGSSVLDAIRGEFGAAIRHWGYIEDRDAYVRVLAESDVVVSTALHEFFGIAVIEAIAAGAFPVLPDRLAYPEVMQNLAEKDRAMVFYDGTADELVARLKDAENAILRDGGIYRRGAVARRAVSRFRWNAAVPLLDQALRRMMTGEGLSV